MRHEPMQTFKATMINMMTKFSRVDWRPRWIFIVLTLSAANNMALGATVSLQPMADNTLYEFDPSDIESPFNSNGAGDMISAGRTRSRGQLRRGLLQFDFDSIPAGAQIVPGSVQLTLEVVDSPRRDTSGEARDFWLVPLPQAWGEGSSAANAGVSGAGSGASATPGDATWLHTIYDPNQHQPYAPLPTEPGYWDEPGVLGSAAVDPSSYGAPAGSVPAAPYLGPVTFDGPTIETDLNRWLTDRDANFGWLLVGDERVVGSEISSARGFASRESSDAPPILSFEYTVVPEPANSFGWLLVCLLLVARRPQQLARLTYPRRR